MIELVTLFQQIGSQINALLIHKLKKLGYNEAVLLLEKEVRYAKHRLPSFTSTAYLGNTCFKDVESNLNSFGHLKTEKDWIKYLKETLRHNGAPEDLKL